MNTQRNTINLISVVLATTMFGCNETTTSSTSSSLKMVATSTSAVARKPDALLAASSTTPVTFSDGTTTFTLTEARMNVRDIRFNTSSSDTVAGTEYKVTGPYIMNLLDGSALPKAVVFDAPAGNYQRVDISLDESNIEDGLLAKDDELLTNTLIVKGTHNYNSVTDGTFTLLVKISEVVTFQPTNGIIVSSDAGANTVLNYAVTDWLENPDTVGTKIDLTSCITAKQLMDGNHHIAMSENTQCEGIKESIGNLIKTNMKTKYNFSFE